MPNRSPCRGARRPLPQAFTLVELLVVIGIIALLISILLPSLSRARAAANSVKCAAQIRSIVQAMILHANDHQGYMPLVGSIPTATDPVNLNDSRQRKYEYFDNGGTPNAMGIPASLGKYMGFELDTSSSANLGTDLNRGKFGQIMVCPSDHDGGYIGHDLDNVPNSHFSYAMNEAALGWADPGQKGVTAGGRMRGCSSRFVHSAQLMLLTDANPRGGTNGWLLYYNFNPDCTLNDVYNSANDGFVVGAGQPGPAGNGTGKQCGSGTLFDKARHRGRMNVGFADGHVSDVVISPGDDLTNISLNMDFPPP